MAAAENEEIGVLDDAMVAIGIRVVDSPYRHWDPRAAAYHDAGRSCHAVSRLTLS
jgi:hypothetical protein